MDIFPFIEFNLSRINQGTPLYHIPFIITLYFILYHTLYYTFWNIFVFLFVKSGLFFSCSVHTCFSKLRRQGIVIQFVSVLLSNNAELFSYKNEDKICIKIYLYVYTLIIMAGVWWAITCTKCYEVYIYQLCKKI